MMESDIKSTDNGTYLTITIDENRSYELKMITNNEIDGLVPVKAKSINNKTVLSYDISYSVSYKEKIEKIGISYLELCVLMRAINDLNDTMSDYLLGINNIVLDMNRIFADAGGNIRFCYVPGYEKRFTEQLKTMMEFVLRYIDHKDNQCVMAAYGFYQKILQENYKLHEIIEEFFPEKSNHVEHIHQWEQSEIKEERYDREEPYSIEENEFYKPVEKQDWFRHISIVAVVLSGASIVFSDKFIIDIDLGISVSMIVIIIAANIVKSFVDRRRGSRSEKCQIKEEICMEESDYEGTVLINFKRMVDMNGNEDIDITHYPFIIGKDRESSDYQIKDRKVSRRHIRINSNAGKYYIEDLGSTNGTYLNGDRINANFPVEIQQGDIITISHIKYQFI